MCKPRRANQIPTKTDFLSKLEQLKFWHDQVSALSNQDKFKYQDRTKLSYFQDPYFITLRRLYRCIEKLSTINSDIANIKGKYEYLYKKIKIRDDFEHNSMETIEFFKDTKLKVHLNIFTPSKHILLSGSQNWDFTNDYDDFIKMVEEVIGYLN